MAEVLTKAGVLLAMIVLGYVFKRAHLFGRSDCETVSKLVFRLTLPCAAVTAFSEGFQQAVSYTHLTLPTTSRV